MKHFVNRGHTIQLNWTLHSISGQEFALTGHTYKLFFATGNQSAQATGVTHSGNVLSWTFTPTSQWKLGSYTIWLEVYNNGTKIITVAYPDAFHLVHEVASSGTTQTGTQTSSTTLNLVSSCDFYRFAPVVPVAGDDGYWYVNGAKAVDGNGEYILTSHTLEYDDQTRNLIIDRGRVDSEGNSIEQVITALADLDSYYQAAEGSEDGSVAGDGSRWGSYKTAENARNTAAQNAETARQSAASEAEGSSAGSVAGDGSRWGEFKSAEAERETASETAIARANAAAAAAELMVNIHQGPPGDDGEDGTGIEEVEQTETSIANGGTNKVRITLTDGTYYDIQIKNGSSSNGLFPTSSALAAACPSPKVGDYAFVGDGFPADIYVCETEGTWTDSGEDFDGGNVDLTDYAKKAELTQLEAESVKIITQVIPSAGKTQARENIDIPGVLNGQRANYVSGGFLFTNGQVSISSDWNITDFIPFTSGTIVWRFGTGENVSGNYASVIYYDSNKDYLNYSSSYSYTDDRTLTPQTTGIKYIRISFANTYKGKPNTIPATINGVDYVIKDEMSASIQDADDKRWKLLPLGPLMMGEVSTSSGDVMTNSTYSGKFVAMKSKCVVPFEGVKIRLHTPVNTPYLMSIDFVYCSADGAGLGHKTLFGTYSEEYSLPSNAKAYRLHFRARLRYGASGATNWHTLSVEEIETMLESGGLRVEYYDNQDAGVVERNIGGACKVAAVRRVLDAVNNKKNGMDKLPVFAHISDIHGDAIRFRNFMEYCDAMGWIDFALNSGDATMYDKPDGTFFIQEIAGNSTTPMLYCIGNHDSWPTGQQYLFRDNIEPLVAQQGYLKASGTPADHCYYYMDFDAKKVRVITLNYYEDGVYQGRLGQTQIDWFVGVLASTPAGYGVVVMLHSPEDHILAPEGLDKFMQPSPKYGDTYLPGGFYVGTRPIMQIIDAFIEKNTLNTTYTDHSSTYNGSGDTTTETVTISADFTAVDETTEFICYVCGHRHEDYTGYYEHSTNKQLCLDIVCGIALFGDNTNSAWTGQCDLPRGGNGVQQDAFNIYAIDREGGNVRIARVGANVTIRFADRDAMIIPYKD